MSKRSRPLENYFGLPPAKKQLMSSPSLDDKTCVQAASSNHATYPFPVPVLPASLQETLNFVPASEGCARKNQPDLDLVVYQPYIPKQAEQQLFKYLRQELFFYRVRYTIKRGSVETQINTPRFTTVFGIDETSTFTDQGDIADHVSRRPVPASAYKCRPRPIPQCLDLLRQLTENVTGCKFNFVLVNYYASGNDSISYHSDDERFLGVDPAIASLSLGATRDFLMKHKPSPTLDPSALQPIKIPLASGDMVLMQGKTQSNCMWMCGVRK